MATNQLELQTNQVQAVTYYIEKFEDLHLAPSYTFNVNDGDQVPAVASILQVLIGSSTSSSLPKCCHIENQDMEKLQWRKNLLMIGQSRKITSIISGPIIKV